MNSKTLLIFFFLLSSLVKFELVQGWASGGHIAVAEIAYEQLSPVAKQKCDELINTLTPFYPESESFVKAATWLDLVNLHDFRLLWKWHFSNIPYDPEGILTEHDHKLIRAINADSDICYGLEHAIKTLKSQKANSFEKAFMLRYLLHAVADAHQPLHTCCLFNSQFPNGDQGGNLFTIDSPLAGCLHQLWDLGLGIIPDVPLQETVSDESLKRVHEFVSYIKFIHPKESLSKFIYLPKERWIQDAHNIGESTVYTLQLGAAPSEEYLKNGRAICEKQLALAGYRLGALLNEIFEE